MKRTFFAAVFATLLAIPAFFTTPAAASCGCSMYRTAGSEEVYHFNTPALYAAAPLVGVKVPAFSTERLTETDGPTHCEAMVAMEPVQAYLRANWASMSPVDRQAVRQVFNTTENAVFDLAVSPQVQSTAAEPASSNQGPQLWLLAALAALMVALSHTLGGRSGQPILSALMRR